MKKAALIQKLIPFNITEELVICNITEIVNFYKNDLINPDVVDEDFHQWKKKWLSVPFEDRSQILSNTLKECSSFSILFILLKLLPN